jgi:hypothetical protein
LKTLISAAAFMAVSVACCSAGSDPARPTVPLHPFWNLSQLPNGPEKDMSRMSMPAGSAVLIAPGYLLTSTVSMGAVKEDLGLDPAVWLFDGTSWIKGRYVDYDNKTGLALIRADVPGAAIALTRRTDGILRHVAIPFAKALQSPPVRQEFPLEPCEKVPEAMLEAVGRRIILPDYCFAGRVTAIPGGAFIDHEGRLAGLQTSPTGSPAHAGAGTQAIRDFVNMYFSSWGRDVKDKPKL